MNFDLDTGQWIVIGLSAFFFIWYVYASSVNRRLGIATFRWLRTGLRKFGELSDAEWIGSSNMGARLTVKKANKPFQQVEARYLLEPREFLPYWLASYLRGKRDEVLIRVTLRAAPRVNLELERLIRRNMRNTPDSNPLHPDFQINPTEFIDTALIEKIRAFLNEYSLGVEKITLQRKSPHLEIQARIKPLLRFSAESYCQAVQTWFMEF
jgi:hypothetical protein